MSKDPIVFGGGQGNIYVYVGNDPINRTDPLGLFGAAFGLSADAGFCFGLCVGSWSGGGGVYLGTEGFGVYATGQGGLGVGGHLGAGVQASAYQSLDAFQGRSYGVSVVAAAGPLGGGSIMGNRSGLVGSANFGAGGGLYGGGAVSQTFVYGLSWQDIRDAWNLLTRSRPKPRACFP